jgi:predicted nucleotidyltransferase
VLSAGNSITCCGGGGLLSESNVKQLSPEQRELVLELAGRLGTIQGIKAVVLGGSHARGRAQPGSDVDLGILYSETDPFSIQSVQKLADDINDTPRPVVTNFYEWGPWVNGGAWLTIGGRRIDFLYRSLEHLGRVLTDAESGRYQLDYEQQPPFGFFSATYLGEIAVCVPVFDPDTRIHALKRRVAKYPEALRRAVVQDYLWAAEFGLAAFARKFAARCDAWGTAACLTRAVNQLVLALFALNREYLINDKTALAEATGFERTPRRFESRVQTTFAGLGDSPAKLANAVEGVQELLRESVALAGELYQPLHELPE